MNTDFRLTNDFFTHHKTCKLEKKLSSLAILSLIKLWAYASKYREDGVLSEMDYEDIEIVAGWQGENELFVKTLIGVGFLDATEHGLKIHNWEDHNPWVVKSHIRSDKARFSRLATVNRDAYDELKEKGIGAISKEEYEELTATKRISDINKHSNKNVTNVDEPLTIINESSTVVKEWSTPAPAPSPSPSPTLLRSIYSEQFSIPHEQEVKNMYSVTLPLNTGEEYSVTTSEIEQWKFLYPRVDIYQELRNMRGWLIGNPKKRKTKKGIMRFVQSWLARSQERLMQQPAYSAKQYLSSAERRQQENIEAARVAKKMLFGGEGIYAQARL